MSLKLVLDRNESPRLYRAFESLKLGLRSKYSNEKRPLVWNLQRWSAVDGLGIVQHCWTVECSRYSHGLASGTPSLPPYHLALLWKIDHFERNGNKETADTIRAGIATLGPGSFHITHTCGH